VPTIPQDFKQRSEVKLVGSFFNRNAITPLPRSGKSQAPSTKLQTISNDQNSNVQNMFEILKFGI